MQRRYIAAMSAVAVLVSCGLWGWWSHGASHSDRTVIRGDVSITDHGTYTFFLKSSDTVDIHLSAANPWRHSVRYVKESASCSCSNVRLSSKKVEAGATTELVAAVSLPPVGGEREITCELITSTGKRDLHRFTVVGYPYVSTDADQAAVSFGELSPGRLLEKRVRLKLHAPVQMKHLPQIVAVTPSHDAVSLTLGEIALDEAYTSSGGGVLSGSAELTVVLRPQRLSGRRSASVAVEYKCGDGTGMFTFPVIWEVQSLYEVTPPRTFVRFDEKSVEPKEVAVSVSKRDGDSFSVLAIAECPDWAEATLIPSVDMRAHNVAVRILPNPTRKYRYGVLRLTTDCDVQSSVEIPLAAYSPTGQ